MGFFTTPSPVELLSQSLGENTVVVQWSGSSPLDEASAKLC